MAALGEVPDLVQQSEAVGRPELQEKAGAGLGPKAAVQYALHSSGSEGCSRPGQLAQPELMIEKPPQVAAWSSPPSQRQVEAAGWPSYTCGTGGFAAPQTSEPLHPASHDNRSRGNVLETHRLDTTSD